MVEKELKLDDGETLHIRYVEQMETMMTKFGWPLETQFSWSGLFSSAEIRDNGYTSVVSQLFSWSNLDFLTL